MAIKKMVRMEVCTRVHGTGIFIPYTCTNTTVAEDVLANDLTEIDYIFVKDRPIDYEDIIKPLNRIAKNGSASGRFADEAANLLKRNYHCIPTRCKYARFISAEGGGK